MNKKPRPARRKPRRKAKPTREISYTHQDSSGMPWRFVGGRPVSALADQVMRDCGLEPY